MRAFLVCLLLVCTGTVSIAADVALVLRDDGYYLLTPDSKELVKATYVIDQRTSADDPMPPDEPDTEPTPRANQIAEFTRGVGTREEAVTLAAVLRSLADQGVNGEIAWDTTFRITLNRVSGQVSEQWTEWKGKVSSLANGYSPQFFADVATGISIAYGLDAGSLKAVSNGESVDLGLAREEIKVAEIFALIKMILELLRDLGVFDGEPGAFLPLERFRVTAIA